MEPSLLIKDEDGFGSSCWLDAPLELLGKPLIVNDQGGNVDVCLSAFFSSS